MYHSLDKAFLPNICLDLWFKKRKTYNCVSIFYSTYTLISVLVQLDQHNAYLKIHKNLQTQNSGLCNQLLHRADKNQNQFSKLPPFSLYYACTLLPPNNFLLKKFSLSTLREPKGFFFKNQDTILAAAASIQNLLKFNGESQ